MDHKNSGYREKEKMLTSSLYVAQKSLPEQRESVPLRWMVVQPLRVAGDGPLCSLWDNSTTGGGGSQDAFSILLLISPSLVTQEHSNSKLTRYPGCPEVHVTLAGDNSGGRPSLNCTGSMLLYLTPNCENPNSSTFLTWVTVPLVEKQLL